MFSVTAFTEAVEQASPLIGSTAQQLMKITIDFPKPLVTIADKVKLVSVGYQHSFAVTDSNKVYSWIPASPQQDPLEV